MSAAPRARDWSRARSERGTRARRSRRDRASGRRSSSVRLSTPKMASGPLPRRPRRPQRTPAKTSTRTAASAMPPVRAGSSSADAVGPARERTPRLGSAASARTPREGVRRDRRPQCERPPRRPCPARARPRDVRQRDQPDERGAIAERHDRRGPRAREDRLLAKRREVLGGVCGVLGLEHDCCDPTRPRSRSRAARARRDRRSRRRPTERAGRDDAPASTSATSTAPTSRRRSTARDAWPTRIIFSFASGCAAS